MVICLEQGADLHMAQLMPLPLTVSCFSKIQIGFAFLVPAHPGSPGQRAVKLVCVCVCQFLIKGIDTVSVTLLRRTPASSPYSECTGCRQRGLVGSKNLHQQNPPVFSWRCLPMKVDLYSGRKMVVGFSFLFCHVWMKNIFVSLILCYL